MSQLSRLVWKCRRGTKELDIIFERFLQLGYPQLDERGKVLFEQLLDQEDDQLQAYFLSDRKPTDGELAQLVDHILAVCRATP